jgi:hypothetical protein
MDPQALAELIRIVGSDTNKILKVVLVFQDGSRFTHGVADVDIVSEQDDTENETDKPFIPRRFQRAILDALDGVALRTDALGAKVGDRGRLFKRNGIKELREQGLVDRHPSVGFYRPDAPPPEFSQEPKPAKQEEKPKEEKPTSNHTYFAAKPDRLDELAERARQKKSLFGSDLLQKLARHSMDFRAVHWFGADYTFTATQAAAVRILWKAWEDGVPAVGQSAILEDAGSEQGRLRDVFRHSPAWGSMIVSDTKGAYRLAQPETVSHL